MPLHLPGYDTYDALSATPIQRITFTVSNEERARGGALIERADLLGEPLPGRRRAAERGCLLYTSPSPRD